METPELFPDLTLKENETRLQVLDFFYACDGRDDKAHPLHSRYTGLFEKYVYLVGCATVGLWTKEGLWTKDWDWVEELAYGVMFGDREEEEGDAQD